MLGTRSSAFEPRACATDTLTDVSTALQQSHHHEKQIRAKAAGSERVRAERAEQDGVGHAHRHLRQLRDGVRRRETRRIDGVTGKGRRWLMRVSGARERRLHDRKPMEKTASTTNCA